MMDGWLFLFFGAGLSNSGNDEKVVLLLSELEYTYVTTLTGQKTNYLSDKRYYAHEHQ